MHEVSLVRNIIRTLEDEFGAEGVARVRDVYLRVGLLSNVEPALMQNAFWAVQAAERCYDQLTLHVEVLPILVVCELCGHESTITNYRFRCAACDTPTKNITQGTELLIHRVSFEEESQPATPSHP
ncbi:hydrogenase maturation nickel metallochaperone HypA/HybF [Hymenobacter terricola]|uniref:hydrogenase maturation nickel metallochaperone HypA/HybF n=1 Tax=Hymenobacter terricola TaxID=2819236 RepID=UPI001B3156FF|nr:hydrogenase maturation nickel metallochaperone HypA [Hymenobacter terricola]